MFCSFDRSPDVVRLHGTGRVVSVYDAEYAEWAARFTETRGARAVIVVDVERVSDSCGYGVPLMDFAGERDLLPAHMERKGDRGPAGLPPAKNRTSVTACRPSTTTRRSVGCWDGVPTCRDAWQTGLTRKAAPETVASCVSTFLYAPGASAEDRFTEPLPRTRVAPRLPTGPRGFFVGHDSRQDQRKADHERAGHRDSRHRCAEPDQVAGVRRRRDTSSASRAARSSRRTTRCSTPRRSGTSSSGTSRAPGTPPRATPSATGRVGVCMATSGPGATNLVTPIADAYMDSVPMVAVTGQVASAAIGTDAFQEADIRGITMPITKHNFLVTDPAEIPRTVAEAFYIASTGRPGPVLVDVAKDAMQAMTTFRWPTELHLPGYRPVTRPHAKQIREAARLILEARRPVLYVGGGVIRARASQELRVLAELTGMPVVTTLMARGAFPDSHPQHLGMPGMHGTVAAVAGLQRSDLIISLGARFDDRVTGNLRLVRAARAGHPRRHRPGRDRQEPARRRPDRRRRPRGDRRPGRRAAGRGRRRPPGRLRGLGGVPRRGEEEVPARLRHSPPTARSRRSTSSSGSARSPAPRRSTSPASASTRCGPRTSSATSTRGTWINSGGLGTMGFSVPAAMGAKVGRPDATVWSIDGDGCFQMTNQELATCAIEGIPIKVAIINNESLGMVRQWQTLFYNERYSNTDLQLQADPGLREARRRLRLRRAGLRLARTTSTRRSTRRWRSTTCPVVVDFRVHRDAMVWPMVAAGTSNDDIKFARDLAPDFENDDLEGGRTA